MKKMNMLMSALLVSMNIFTALAADNTLTLRQCLGLAKEHDKSVKAAQSQAEAAEYTRKSVRANFLPSFEATGGALWSDADFSLAIPGGLLPVVGADGNPTGAGAYFPGYELNGKVDWICSGRVTVTQPVFMGGKIVAGYRMSQLGRDIAWLNIKLREDEVVLQTATAYANVIRAKELHKVQVQYNDLLEELLRTVRMAEANGMGDRNDVMKVEVKVNEGALNLKRTENAVRLAKMNLCHYIGYPLGSDIDIAESSLPESGLVTETADISNRPEYQMLDKKVQAAAQQIRVTRADALPQVGIFAGYGYTHGLTVNDETFIDNAGFSVGAKVSIPIFHFGERFYKVRSDKSKYEQAVAERDSSYELMTLEMSKAANELEESEYERVLAASNTASAEENLRVSRLHYDSGTETLSGLLEAQTLWQLANRDSVESDINRFLAWLSYLKTTGDLNPVFCNGQ